MSRLRQYVRRGPYAGGASITKRMLGAWLWWRSWLVVGILLAAILVLYTGPYIWVDARLWGFIVGAVTIMILDAIDDREFES